MKRDFHAALLQSGLCTLVLFVAPAYSTSAQPPASLPEGVQRLCSVAFSIDSKRPARLQNDALPCLALSVQRLKQRPDLKLVLVGLKDEAKDHEAEDNGHMREEEDSTGYDVRLEDLAAYRSLNTKGYLIRWYGIDPVRILPTTDESIQGQEVVFYLVPGRPTLIIPFWTPRRRMRAPVQSSPAIAPMKRA